MKTNMFLPNTFSIWIMNSQICIYINKQFFNGQHRFCEGLGWFNENFKWKTNFTIVLDNKRNKILHKKVSFFTWIVYVFLRLIKQYLPYISIPYPIKCTVWPFLVLLKYPVSFKAAPYNKFYLWENYVRLNPKVLILTEFCLFGNCERAFEFREDWVWFSALAVDCFNLNSFRIQELNWNLMRGEGRATLKSKFNQNQGKIPNWMWLENIHSL